MPQDVADAKVYMSSKSNYRNSQGEKNREGLLITKILPQDYEILEPQIARCWKTTLEKHCCMFNLLLCFSLGTHTCSLLGAGLWGTPTAGLFQKLLICKNGGIENFLKSFFPSSDIHLLLCLFLYLTTISSRCLQSQGFFISINLVFVHWHKYQNDTPGEEPITDKGLYLKKTFNTLQNM